MKTSPLKHVPGTLAADPIREGLASGWKAIDASTLEADGSIEADVAIVGTGAGGGVSAEILAAAGLRVIMIEEGPLKSTHDFKMREADAYPELYQEGAGRRTADKAIGILQGRAVGGGTTVNWTASFRTPEPTLAWWQKHYGLKDYAPESLAPWFAMMEQRLNISPWAAPPNPNNDALRRGAQALGISTAVIPRNVKGCWNIGYCGMGCPTNAKQSMLVTSIPAALAKGATLITRTRADKLEFEGDRVASLQCVALAADGLRPTGKRIRIRARHFIIAGGAINSPGLLLRSRAPDPHGLLGKRTFLHPTVLSAAMFEQRIDGYSGAPQSIYSDHFLAGPVDGPIGYKLEVPPLHPLLFAATMQGFGKQHTEQMKQFPHTQVVLALLRDGFHADSPGGAVRLRSDGSPELDYPLTGAIWDGARRAFLSMAEIQFAAGAKSVYPVHESVEGYSSWASAKKAIEALPYQPFMTRVVSAHAMGGCAMSDDTRLGLVSSAGQYHGIDNLSVHDGSLFPTSLGANPQLSIYGITAKLASGLAEKLTGKKAPRLSASA